MGARKLDFGRRLHAREWTQTRIHGINKSRVRIEIEDLDTKRGRRLADCGEFCGNYQRLKNGSERCVNFLIFRTLGPIEGRRADSK